MVGRRKEGKKAEEIVKEKVEEFMKKMKKNGCDRETILV